MQQSNAQKRTSTGGQSTNSINSDSPSTGTSPPPQQGAKPKAQKHVVHHSNSKQHKRVSSNKGLHKLTKVHGNDGSHTDLQSKRNASATNLRKNNSAVSLKRNRSAAEVGKRPKSSGGVKSERKVNTSVHFEIGDTDDGDGAWEEASSSASPALSRAPSRSGQSSAKLSANSSRPTSPRPQSPLRQETAVANGARAHNADAKFITDRLLQRAPSNATTTKMSLMTATPNTGHSSDSLEKDATTTANGTPATGSDLVSRFVGGSGTPSENSRYLNDNSHPLSKGDAVKRAQSMGNLTRHDSLPLSTSSLEADTEAAAEESALAPRSRKSSTAHAYNPPQQSRTQQKLWLQRASSNIEPQQMTPGGMGLGLNSLHHGGFGNPLVGGATYDGRDPRIKVQLERTGLEYLVVRRHQDPIGLGLKRLERLPGAESRRIPGSQGSGLGRQSTDGGSGRYGLSQSLKGTSSRASTTGRGSFEDGERVRGGSGERDRDGGDGNGNGSVSAILRRMWDKSYDFSASAD